MTILRDKIIAVLLVIAGILCGKGSVCAAGLHDRLLNRPYTDQRPWHLGFGFGMNFTTLALTHTGEVNEAGESWFMEQPTVSPGFSVCGVVNFRLNDSFSLRLTPGISFSSRELKMLDASNGLEASQNIKSTFVQVPVDLKYSSVRFGNLRPYVSGGVMAAFDIAKSHTDMLRLKSGDMYLCFAVGSDFYLPYFKLIPELKFCIGLTDVLQHNRPDLADNPNGLKFTRALQKMQSRMVVLTFYFE